MQRIAREEHNMGQLSIAPWSVTPTMQPCRFYLVILKIPRCKHHPPMTSHHIHTPTFGQLYIQVHVPDTLYLNDCRHFAQSCHFHPLYHYSISLLSESVKTTGFSISLTKLPSELSLPKFVFC